jgi:hypothetical protein
VSLLVSSPSLPPSAVFSYLLSSSFSLLFGIPYFSRFSFLSISLG